MEFACGFVYVPPSVTQRDANRSNPTKLSGVVSSKHKKLSASLLLVPGTAATCVKTHGSRHKAVVSILGRKAELKNTITLHTIM